MLRNATIDADCDFLNWSCCETFLAAHFGGVTQGISLKEQGCKIGIKLEGCIYI